jgi:hypothetical protein
VKLIRIDMVRNSEQLFCAEMAENGVPIVRRYWPAHMSEVVYPGEAIPDLTTPPQLLVLLERARIQALAEEPADGSDHPMGDARRLDRGQAGGRATAAPLPAPPAGPSPSDPKAKASSKAKAEAPNQGKAQAPSPGQGKNKSDFDSDYAGAVDRQTALWNAAVDESKRIVFPPNEEPNLAMLLSGAMHQAVTDAAKWGEAVKPFCTLDATAVSRQDPEWQEVKADWQRQFIAGCANSPASSSQNREPKDGRAEVIAASKLADRVKEEMRE